VTEEMFKKELDKGKAFHYNEGKYKDIIYKGVMSKANHSYH